MTRRPRIAGLVAGGAVLLAGPLAAQLGGSLDVGAGTYRPDRAIPGGVASIAPTVYFDGDMFRIGASGIYSDAPAGRWNFQGATMAQLRSPTLGPVRLEGTGQLEFTRHFAARGVTAATAELRANLRPFRGAALWAGQVRGTVSFLGGSRPLRRNLLGASARVGGVEIGLSVASSTFELMGGVSRGTNSGEVDTTTTGLPVGPEESGQSPATRRMSLTDALLSSRWRAAGVDLDLAFGRRFARGTPELTIWGVSASRSLTSNLALVAGAGRAGSDPVTAVPGSRYLVLGLRLKLGPPLPAAFGPLPKASDNTPFQVGPALPAGREIVVRAPGASQVELAGDFTDWRPVALQPSGDHGWRAVLPIRPGLHRLAVRFDRGAWQAPPGSRPIRNEFGGEVTEIVVE
jgi:hypothetical protein